MKKKVILLVLGINICLGILFYLQVKDKDNLQKNNIENKNNFIAIMIKENGATDYVKSSSSNIPIGDYTLNKEKTYCENNGIVSNYNRTNGSISLSFEGSDKCYLYFDYIDVYGWETILVDNIDGATNSSDALSKITELSSDKLSSVTTSDEKGIYKTKDDLGMSYYFRGAVNNNWVVFANMYWRIIRINGDNTIRMIYSGKVGDFSDAKFEQTDGVYIESSDTSIGRTKYNERSDYAEFVGYQYIIGKQHGYGKCAPSNETCIIDGATVYNSTIKQVLENWYEENILPLDENDFVSDQIFCNDRSASTSDVIFSNTNYTTLSSWQSQNMIYYYGTSGRTWYSTLSTSLLCPLQVDQFTVDKHDNIGNGALSYPVGLITSDELNFAGSPAKTDNYTFYLYNGDYYYTGSPNWFKVSAYVDVMTLARHHANTLSYYNANNGYAIRPVISLSSNVKLIGSGTWNDPYEVDY